MVVWICYYSIIYFFTSEWVERKIPIIESRWDKPDLARNNLIISKEFLIQPVNGSGKIPLPHDDCIIFPGLFSVLDFFKAV